MDPLTGHRADRYDLGEVRRAPWGDVGNSTLHWCTYRGHSYLFKEYSTEFRAEVQTHALGGLIDWRDKLAPDDRDWLDRVASWPRFQVVDDGLVVGVLVPPAPQPFYKRSMSGGGSHPRSMEYLIRFDTGEGEAKGASVRDKRRAIGNAAAALLWFHRQNIRVNDLRESNILCTADGTAVYYVDCDVMMGPWGVVSPGAAPEYLAAVLRHKPDPFEPPSRETELARVAWLATFILLNDFRLRDVPVERLTRHTGAAEADLLRRTAMMHSIDINDWHALARNWAENPWVGYARVPGSAAEGPEEPPGPGSAQRPTVVTATVRMPPTRVLASERRSRRPNQWLPEHLRQAQPPPAPFPSLLDQQHIVPAAPPTRGPGRFALVTIAAVVLVFGLIAAYAAAGGA